MKLKTLLLIAFVAVGTSLSHAQALGWDNNRIFSAAPYCQGPALSATSASASPSSTDVCLVRSGSSGQFNITKNDLSTAGSLGAFTAAGAIVFAAGLTASGAVANDFSGSSGAFKPSTGTFTFQAAAVAASAGANNFDLSASSGTFKPPTGAGTFGGSSNTFSGTSPQIDLGVSGSVVGAVTFENATSGKISLQPPTGALGTPSVTLPAITGSLLTAYNCGTIAANGACANTALAGTAHIVQGIATLSGSASTITGLSPAFTSSSSYFCVGNDITTRANPVQVIPASASTVTITNTTGATDNISFVCVGN